MRSSAPVLTIGFVLGLVLAFALATLRLSGEVSLSAPADLVLDCPAAPLRQRAGQVLVVGLPGVVQPYHPLVDEVAEVGVGGVLLTKANVRNAAQVRRLVAAVREASPLPVLVATDEEPGRVSSFGVILGRFSSARTMARRGSPADVETFAHQLGVELANLGVDADLGPVADVDDGPAQGIIGDRSFSGDPEVAARYALAFSRGLRRGGVQPVPKHFPGHGRSRVDSHRELGVVDVPLDELRATDLVPFRVQIRAGVRMIMMSHVAYTAIDPDLPASVSPRAYALLRSMGFDGVAITDSVGMGPLHGRWGYGGAAVRAIAAGADAVLATDGHQAKVMRDALVAAVQAGQLDDARLAEAAGRMVAMKGMDPRVMTCPGSL